MKQKQIALFTLLSFCIAGNMVSCLDISKPNNIGKDTNLNLKDSSQGSLKDILLDDEVKCDKEKGFSVKSTEGFPPAPEPEHVHITKDDVVGFYPGKKNKEAVTQVSAQVNQPLSEYISIGFKDEYKIRLKTNSSDDNKDDIKSDDKAEINKEVKNQKKFYSEAGYNVKELNELIEEDIVKEITSYAEGLDVAYFEELERKGRAEDPINYNFVSITSSFVIKIKPKEKDKDKDDDKEYEKKVRKFIANLKNSKFVSFAAMDQTISTSDSAFKHVPKEPIFINSSTLDGLTSSVDENSRYQYPRMGYDKSMGSIYNRNTNSTTLDDITFNPVANTNGVSIAVIDVGFNPSHLDNPFYDQNRKMYCDSASCTVGELPQNDLTTPHAIDFDFKDASGNTVNPENKNHGGRMAYIIGGKINGIGLAGLASYPVSATSPTQIEYQNPVIVPVRIASSYDPITNKVNPYFNPIARAINTIVTNNMNNNNPIRVISISISPDNGKILEDFQIEDTFPVKKAISDARLAGVLVVNSAGNNNIRLANGQGNNSLVVGGTAKYSNKRWAIDATTGSNYGSRIDISAPAEEIISQGDSTSNYAIGSGTSESTAMVAATALLIFASRPDLKNNMTFYSVDRVKNLIVFSGKPI
jgi:hypothetical protein